MKQLSFIPDRIRNTAFLMAFGFLKVPLIFFVSPSVVELSDSGCVIKIRLGRRTRNHLGSMYFGALCIGADCAGGMLAMRSIRGSGKKISLIFKDLKADFLKRAEGDVYFSNEQGVEVSELVKRVIESGQRENLTVNVVATVPSKFGSEPVARFALTLSLKRKHVHRG